MQAGCVDEFLQRVESEIESRRLLARGQKILVAVSGGADSMALLRALQGLANKNRWKLFVAHFNHQLRGRASVADEKFVGRTAEKLRLKCFHGRADVKAMAARSGMSVEMAARKLRHDFLARVARENKIPVVALAHHADDQVELFFLRLLRGAGGEGLAGMKWRSPSPSDKAVRLVRPLLGFSKSEILEFARAHNVKFRADTTNFSNDFLRNRIRNELLPLLQKKYQPGLTRTVLRMMEITGAESGFVSEAAERFCSSRREEAQIKSGKRKSESGNKSEPPHVGRYDDLPLAVQRKVLQQQLIVLGLQPDFELIEQLREGSWKWVSVGPGLSVARNAAGKVCSRKVPANEFNPCEFRMKFSGRAGRAEFAGQQYSWALKNYDGSRRRSGPDWPSPRQAEFFDAKKIGGEIVLRHWRAGDRFQPIGLASPVKLQDLFVNAKIPARRRREVVLAATASGEIFWVEGLRIGENFKLTGATKRMLAWNWSKLPA